MSKVYIESRTVRYQPESESDRIKLLTHGLTPSFNALSVGTKQGTLCLVPLDESSLENAELIVKLWNEYHENLEEEKWMKNQTKQQ